MSKIVPSILFLFVLLGLAFVIINPFILCSSESSGPLNLNYSVCVFFTRILSIIFGFLLSFVFGYMARSSKESPK